MFSKDQVQSLLNCTEIIKEFPPSGQKQVFLVNDSHRGTVVAKFVRSGDARVQREIEIVTQNNINNVPKILEVKPIDTKIDEKYLCIIEQYINGKTLKDILKNGKLSTIEGLNLLDTLLNIAVQLESIKVVHRDIKPDNIICENQGKYYLIDFGIARQLDKTSLTMTQAAVGPHTPGYGAPELFQYSKKDIDIRADLFSIGIVLFESLIGEHPFITGNEININQIWYETKTITPKSVSIDGDTHKQLLSFIQTLMHKHPTRRPPTAKKALEWYKSVIPTLDLEER